MTLEEIHRAVSAGVISPDFSSVYRAVLHLEREGELARVDLGDGAARYERAGGHHDHVRCESCGVVGALPECVLGQVSEAVLAMTGFAVSEHSVVLSGRCAGCRGLEEAR